MLSRTMLEWNTGASTPHPGSRLGWAGLGWAGFIEEGGDRAEN